LEESQQNKNTPDVYLLHSKSTFDYIKQQHEYGNFVYQLKKKMSIEQKLLNTVGEHPKLATFAIGLAITMSIAAVIGMFDNQHLALTHGGKTSSSGDGG
jgi:hypothetical protein